MKYIVLLTLLIQFRFFFWYQNRQNSQTYRLRCASPCTPFHGMARSFVKTNTIYIAYFSRSINFMTKDISNERTSMTKDSWKSLLFLSFLENQRLGGQYFFESQYLKFNTPYNITHLWHLWMDLTEIIYGRQSATYVVFRINNLGRKLANVPFT